MESKVIINLKAELSKVFPDVDYWFNNEEPLSVCKVFFEIDSYKSNLNNLEYVKAVLFFLKDKKCSLNIGYLYNSLNLAIYKNLIKNISIASDETQFNIDSLSGRQIEVYYVSKNLQEKSRAFEPIEKIKNDKNEIIGEK